MNAAAPLRRIRRWVWMALAAFLLLLVLPEYLVEWLWMEAVGYASVFWKLLGLKGVLFAAGFLVAGAYLGANFVAFLRQLPPLWFSRLGKEGELPHIGGRPLTPGRLRGLALGGAAVLSLLFAAVFSGAWDPALRFYYAQDYGLTDPVFGKDVAFYMLELPFWELLQDAVVGLAFLALFMTGAGYVLAGELRVGESGLHVRPGVARHLAANLIVLLVGWAWGFYLDRYGLLLAPGPAVYGADYTDLHVRLPVLWILTFATLGLAGVVALQLRAVRLRTLVWGAAGYALLLVLGLGAAPALMQQLLVEPNELALEEPYLRHNIEFTREAFGLDDIETRSYPAQPTLTMEQVREGEQTIRNIRLWDPRLLIGTYRQIQEIRTYYQFYEVDMDRYRVDGEVREVMVSGRELTQQLPGGIDSWVNRHLIYTHGFGAVANLVAEKDEEGTPVLLLRDLPPQTPHPALRVEQPAIYYGERTPTYNLVNTGAQELHYPQGDENVYVHYDGTGGVPLGGFWKQLLFAWEFSDYNIILSEYITEESRIQFWNRVQERVSRIAPFLRLDADPYLVLAGDRHYWIQDAYTAARNFPYGERVGGGAFGGVSYLRNSVKVVVDAYDGDVSFYVTDPDDPVLGAYAAAFPDVFRPLEAMDGTLQEHLRYPKGLFQTQVSKYARYHMTSPGVFYNNEDLWTRPVEQYGGDPVLMEPYYILTRLPDQDRLEFLLMIPYTPSQRDNMIAWLAARSDVPAYGELVVYELPKQELIYGPRQVEARIDQDPLISEQLTLWDQRGSRVIRGNMIVVPIEESFLYVEPVFLIAEGIEIPQLRRVIVSYGERVAMAPTLEEALTTVVGEPVLGAAPMQRPEAAAAAAAEGERPAAALPAAGARPMPAELSRLEDARDALRRAREALRAGDFSTFGEAFEALERALEEASADTAGAAATPEPGAGGGSDGGGGGSPADTAGADGPAESGGPR